MHDQLKGSLPVGFVVVKAGVKETEHDGIAQDLIQRVRDGVGAIVCYRTTFFAPRLPKTRSGKGSPRPCLC